MKSSLLKYTAPIGLGLGLFIITFFASSYTGCEKETTASNSGSSSGATAYCNPGYTYNYSSQKCCPNSTPYYYPGTHGIQPAGCYSSCPYVGDCGTRWTRY